MNSQLSFLFIDSSFRQREKNNNELLKHETWFFTLSFHSFYRRFIFGFISCKTKLKESSRVVFAVTWSILWGNDFHLRMIASLKIYHSSILQTTNKSFQPSREIPCFLFTKIKLFLIPRLESFLLNRSLSLNSIWNSRKISSSVLITFLKKAN